MPEMIDITGNVYNRFTVIGFVKKDKSASYWRVRCQCGKEKVLRKADFVYGATKSCGCLKEEIRLTATRFGHAPSPQKVALMAKRIKSEK